jgi:hypothetical protein
MHHHAQDRNGSQSEEEAGANDRRREGPRIRNGRSDLPGNPKLPRDGFDGLFERIGGQRHAVEIRRSSSADEGLEGVLRREDYPQEEAR